jgi:hypothetical protein
MGIGVAMVNANWVVLASLWVAATSPSEKPTVSQLLEKFPPFYGLQETIAVFTKACHFSLS